MPRPLRIEDAGAVYHVMARGDRREGIVRGDVDRAVFERVLAQVVGKTGWEVLAWTMCSRSVDAAARVLFFSF